MSDTGVHFVGVAAALCLIWAGLALAGTQSQTNPELARAASLAAKSAVLLRNGDFSGPEPLLREALAIRERLLPAGDLAIAEVLNDLGASLHYRSHYKEAESAYKRALDIFESKDDCLQQRVSTSANLASLYRDLRDFDRAAAIYSRAFALIDKSPTMSESTIATLNMDYGLLLRAKGDWDGAERYLGRAAGICENAHDPALISVLSSLADLNFARRDYDAAENLFRQTVEKCQNILGPDDRRCASPLNGLALALARRGLNEEAEKTFRRALAIFERTYGPDHPKVAAVLNNLGTLAEHRRDYKHAETYLSHAIAIWTSAFGPEHPDVAAADANLATVYMRQHSWAKSESYYQQALLVDQKLFGPDTERVAVDLNNLGVLFSTMKRWDDAEQWLKRSAAVYERAAGPDSPALAGILINLANQHLAAKRYEDAAPLFKRALDIYERHPGAESAVAASAFESYAKIMRKSADFAEAQKAEAFAMRIRVKNTIARDRLQTSFAGRP